MKLDIDLKKCALFVIQPYTLQDKQADALMFTKKLKILGAKMLFWSYSHQATDDFFELFPQNHRVIEFRKERPKKKKGKYVFIDFCSNKYLDQRVKALKIVSKRLSSAETVFVLGGRTELCIWALFRDILPIQNIPNVIFVKDLVRGILQAVKSPSAKKSGIADYFFVSKENHDRLLQQIESGQLEVEKI